MNYLIWKNKDSREIDGLVICELPPVSKPEMRVVETIIDGVDGSIIEEVGYSSYDKALIIGLTQNANIDDIVEYFTGVGEVIFSNEPKKYYKARILTQIDYIRLARFKTATVTFKVQPFKYEYEEEQTIVTAENMGEELLVENKGNYFSKPVIEIRGSGTIALIVNGDKMFSYTFPDGEEQVIIDSDKQDAYIGTVLKNRNMVGEFPTFDIGLNTIAWEGDVTSLIISSKSRWI